MPSLFTRHARRGTNIAKLNHIPATDHFLHVQSQVTAHVDPVDFLPGVSRFLHCYSHHPPPSSFLFLIALFLAFV